MARPSEYTDEIVTKAHQYLDSCFEYMNDPETKIKSVKIPTIEGLAVYLGIHKDTVYEWEKSLNENKELKYPLFSDVIALLRAKQANALINHGLSGNYNPTIAKVLLTKHGYREGIDQTTNDKDLPTPLLNAVFDNNSDKESSEAQEED